MIKTAPLKCVCKDVSEWSDRQESKVQVAGEKKQQAFVKTTNLVGKCSCSSDGEAKEYDGINLSIESEQPPREGLFAKRLAELGPKWIGVPHSLIFSVPWYDFDVGDLI